MVSVNYIVAHTKELHVRTIVQFKLEAKIVPGLQRNNFIFAVFLVSLSSTHCVKCLVFEILQLDDVFMNTDED